ncbi:MAG: 16S rRNA (guanine(527)-N(7))-methyltransferase RsmG [Clostridia bacterium]|nr:16S rRNA (guanine(527)-N(7))-methyltransferase RsmG [Clostridia bacterium]
MIDYELLREQVASFGVTLTDEMCEKFDRYAELLVEWNEKMNLTAITDPVGIAVKHFADSLSAVPLLPEKQGIAVIDVGTGAGFPGIPLAIVRPDMRLTLLDSLNKRLTFLSEVCCELGITATTVHARAEEGARGALRERFDVATARAVAALPVLSEYCLPYVKVGGRFVAMKGPESEAECAQAKRAIGLLGGGKPVCHALQLTADGETLDRRLFVIEKQKSTPAAYPRPTAKIKKGAL